MKYNEECTGIDSDICCIFSDHPIYNTSTSTSVSHAIGDKNVELYCGICANPIGKIYWHFQGRALFSDIKKQGPKLIISSVESHHFGKYTCIAEGESKDPRQHGKWRKEFSVTLNSNGE